MTKHEHIIPEVGEITVCVLTEQEFDAFLQEMRKCSSKDIRTLEPMTDEQVQRCKDAMQVPLIRRGELTEQLFTYLKVDKEYMSICQQGFAEKVMSNIDVTNIVVDDDFIKQCQKTYDSLPQEVKVLVDSFTDKIVKSEIGDVPRVINEFLGHLNSAFMTNFDTMEFLQQMIISIASTGMKYSSSLSPEKVVELWPGYINRLLIGAAGAWKDAVTKQNN